MSDDLNEEYERQLRLQQEYEQYRVAYNQEVEREKILVADLNGCIQDVNLAARIISGIQRIVAPPLESTQKRTDHEQVIAYNASIAIDDVVDKYKLMSAGSTASKNLTGLQDKYDTYYGLYNQLRQVSLGYVVGADKEFWQSDAPRQMVEKSYLANTDYWLAYAIMAVVLWVSDEQNACNRAIAKAMEMDARRSALFFLLVTVRFNRMEEAREWYSLYFRLIDLNGLNEDILYLLQVLLSGALGADMRFAAQVRDKMKSLYAEAAKDFNSTRLAQESVDNYFNAFVSVTDKEFLGFKHICADYDAMMSLLSDAEKNDLLRKYFLTVLNEESPLSDRLSERIEDALYSLISANDVNEQKLLDKIRYQEMIVKANGDVKAADQAYASLMSERKTEKNLILIMLNSILDPKSKADARVKKFSMSFVRHYCVAGAERFSQYRKREKRDFDLEVDGCKLHGDENSFAQNKPKLQAYYNGLIAERIRGDKKVKNLAIGAAVCALLCVLFAVVGVLGLLIPAEQPFLAVGQAISFFVITAVTLAGFILCLFFRHGEKEKIRKSFEFRIANGMRMLEEGLQDMAAWRTAYHEADAVYDELIKVLKEETTNG